MEYFSFKFKGLSSLFHICTKQMKAVCNFKHNNIFFWIELKKEINLEAKVDAVTRHSIKLTKSDKQSLENWVFECQCLETLQS